MEGTRSSSTPDSNEKVLRLDEENDESSFSDLASTVSDSTENASRPRKRKRNAGHEPISHFSHRRRLYSAKYHRLFNRTVQDLQIDFHEPGGDGSDFSQVGVSIWSTQEKSRLLHAIARHGRDNLPMITALIGTKSDLEARAYLQLLQEASDEQHMYGEKRSLTGTADVPAAIELSDQCCGALDQAADALAILQQLHEEQVEKQKHSDLWKLDQRTAQWIDRRLSESEEGRNEVRRRLPAAEILDIGQFLKLSTNIFMNSSHPDSDCRSFVSRSEKPSMLYTAFADLYSLFLSVTKRLIQSSLFFAMSRLRATQSSAYAHQRAVKQADVIAAVKVLGMKENARDFWVEIPRRCRLNVYDQSKMIDSGETMDYQKVESILAQAKSDTDKRFVTTNPGVNKEANPSSIEGSSSESESQSVTSSLSNRSSSNDTSSQTGASADLSAPGERFGQRTDVYLEHADQEASRQEELRLWKILGRDPPAANTMHRPSVYIKDPGPHRKYKDDMDDWRGWVDFRPEWEACDLNVLKEDLVQTRRQSQIHSGKLARAIHRRRPVCRSQVESVSQVPQPSGTSSIYSVSLSKSQFDRLDRASEDERWLHEERSVQEEDSRRMVHYLENHWPQASEEP
ncbi:MAG: hypothetical protein Q9170_004622 [Blastenia crenularia]